MFRWEFEHGGNRFLAEFETETDDHAGQYPVDVEFKMATEDNRYWPLTSSLLTDKLDSYFCDHEFGKWLENEEFEDTLRRAGL
jgi:hypothetical protein